MKSQCIVCFFLLVALTSRSVCAERKKPYYFSIEVQEHVNPLDYYPLEVGTTWVYDHIYKKETGLPAHIITRIWESEETVVAHHDYPEGKLITLRVKNRHLEYLYPPGIDPQTLEQFLERHAIKEEEIFYYFIRGNYIYTLSTRHWNAEQNALSQDFRRRIQHTPGTASFFFPMEDVVVWGNRSRETKDYQKGELWKQGKGPPPSATMFYWYVGQPTKLCLPSRCFRHVFPLIYRQPSGPEKVWFKKGVGIIQENIYLCKARNDV